MTENGDLRGSSVKAMDGFIREALLLLSINKSVTVDNFHVS